MVRKLTLCVGLLLLVAIAFAQAPAPKTKVAATSKTAATEQALIEKEKQLWEAWKNHDPEPFRQLLTENAILIEEDGVYNKAQYLDVLTKHSCQIKNVAFTDVKLTMIDKDSAALTYKAAIDGTCNGQPVPLKHYATIYTIKTGQWMMATHQSSNVKQD